MCVCVCGESTWIFSCKSGHAVFFSCICRAVFLRILVLEPPASAIANWWNGSFLGLCILRHGHLRTTAVAVPLYRSAMFYKGCQKAILDKKGHSGCLLWMGCFQRTISALELYINSAGASCILQGNSNFYLQNTGGEINCQPRILHSVNVFPKIRVKKNEAL